MEKTYSIYTPDQFPQDEVRQNFKTEIELLTPYERWLLQLKYFRGGHVLSSFEVAKALGYGATQALQNRYQKIINKINTISGGAIWPHIKAQGSREARTNTKLWRQMLNRKHVIREGSGGQIFVHYGPDSARDRLRVFDGTSHIPIPVELPEYTHPPAPTKPLLVTRAVTVAAGRPQPTPTPTGRFATEIATRREAMAKLASELEVLEAAERVLLKPKE